MPPASRPDPARRRFLKTVGLAGLSSALAPVVASLAQSPAPGGGSYPPGVPPPRGAAPPPGAPPPGAPPEAPSEDARTLGEVIRRRYGKHLGREQIESVVKDLDGDLKAAKRLHEVKLANGDEPDFTFHA